MAKPKKHNWTYFFYIDEKSERHTDPYKVLVLKPIEPSKTAPTYDDMYMFIDKLLEGEVWNDTHLNRPPQLPSKIQRLLRVVLTYVDSEQVLKEMRQIENNMEEKGIV